MKLLDPYALWTRTPRGVFVSLHAARNLLGFMVRKNEVRVVRIVDFGKMHWVDFNEECLNIHKAMSIRMNRFPILFLTKSFPNHSPFPFCSWQNRFQTILLLSLALTLRLTIITCWTLFSQQAPIMSYHTVIGLRTTRSAMPRSGPQGTHVTSTWVWEKRRKWLRNWPKVRQLGSLSWTSEWTRLWRWTGVDEQVCGRGRRWSKFVTSIEI